MRYWKGGNDGSGNIERIVRITVIAGAYCINNMQLKEINLCIQQSSRFSNSNARSVHKSLSTNRSL